MMRNSDRFCFAVAVIGLMLYSAITTCQPDVSSPLYAAQTVIGAVIVSAAVWVASGIGKKNHDD